jgi:hypothetical protein
MARPSEREEKERREGKRGAKRTRMRAMVWWSCLATFSVMTRSYFSPSAQSEKKKKEEE